MLEFTETNFDTEVKNSELPVLVDFWAPWCGPCKALAPTMQKVAEETEGKVKVGKLNVDEAPGIAGKYSIMSIPTLLVFSKGEIVAQMVGLTSKEKILDKLAAYL